MTQEEYKHAIQACGDGIGKGCEGQLEELLEVYQGRSFQYVKIPGRAEVNMTEPHSSQ